MEIITFESKAYKELDNKITAIADYIFNHLDENKTDEDEIWVDSYEVCTFLKISDRTFIIRKSKFPQNPKRSVRFSGKRTKRSVQKRKARNTQKAETKVL